MTERVMFTFAGAQPAVDATHAVYPMSLLFRAGDYADKRYAMSADEIKAAVEHFTPVGGNIEHTRFLRGRACEVRRVWADGDLLRGEVAVPLGLDALLTDDERKLSCEWNRDTKTLSGIALCMNPRVSDAALMSLDASDAALFAGARHSKDDLALIDRIAALLKELRGVEVAEDAEESTEGEAMMTNTGQAAQRAPAARAQFALQEGWTYGDQRTFLEAELQEDFGGGEPYSVWLRDFGTDPDIGDYVLYTARDGSNQRRTYKIVDNDAVWGDAVEGIAKTVFEPVKTAAMSEQEKALGFWETARAFFTGRDPAAPPPAAQPPARAEEHEMADTAALERQISDLAATVGTLATSVQGMQAQFSAGAEQQQRTRAAQYADAAIRAHKALPGERDALVALFAQALADDAAHAATVTFGAGEADRGGRVDALVALVKARPAHRMTEEIVPDNVTTLFADGRDQTKPGSVADDVAAAVAYARANGLAKAE